MKNRNSQTLNALKGATLISLLVGSIISVGVIVSSLGFYKDYVKTTVNLSQSSTFNSQMAFVLRGISQEILGAGFGIDDTNADTQIFIESSSPSQRDLAWASFDGQHECMGLREKHVLDPETEEFHISLVLLEPLANCGAGSLLRNILWQEAEEILQINGDAAKDYISQHSWLFRYTLEDVPCAPFGLNVDTTTSKKRLAIETVSSVALFGNVSFAEGKIAESYCLANVHV